MDRETAELVLKEQRQELSKLRDEIAMRAMQELIAINLKYRPTTDSIAQQAYEMADSMIKARNTDG